MITWVHFHIQVMIQAISMIYAFLHLVDRKQHTQEHLKLVKL